MNRNPNDRRQQSSAHYDEDESVHDLEALEIGTPSQQEFSSETGQWNYPVSQRQGGPSFQHPLDPTNLTPNPIPSYGYTPVQPPPDLSWPVLGGDFLYSGLDPNAQPLDPFVSTPAHPGSGLRGPGLGPVLPNMLSGSNTPSNMPDPSQWQGGSSQTPNTAWPPEPQAHVNPPNPWREPEGPEDEGLSVPTSQATSHESSATEQLGPSSKAKGKRPRRSKIGDLKGQGAHLHSFKLETPASPGPDAMSRSSIGSLASQSTFASTASSSSTQLPSRLRSASRTSKNTRHKPAESPEERRSRASHNLVEKQYRNRLNAEFENLLNAIPDQGRAMLEEDERQQKRRASHGNREFSLDTSDRRVSKSEVLDLARRQIQKLELERDALEKERDDLRTNMKRLCREYGIADPFPETSPKTDPEDSTGDVAA